MHILSFWGMVNMTDELSARDKVMLLPPSGRVHCLQSMMVEIEATPPPEALQHTTSTSQDGVRILF